MIASITSIFLKVTRQGSVTSNTIYSFVSLASQFLTNTVLTIVLARLVEVRVLGEIFYAIAFSNIVSVLVSYGLDNLVIREISQKRFLVSDIFLNLLVSRLILFTVISVLVCIFVIVWGLPLDKYGDIWPYVCAAYADSMIQSLGALRKGVNDFTLDLKNSVFRALLFFIVTLAGILIFGASTSLVGWTRLLSRIMTLILAWFILNRAIAEEGGGRDYGIDFKKIRYLLMIGFPFALQAILGAAYFQVDILILGELSSVAQVGYYQAAMQVVTTGMLVPLSLLQAYYPKLADSLLPGKRAYKLQNQMMVVLVLVGLGLSLFTGVFSPLIIGVLYGEKMSPSILLLQTLTLVFVIRSVAGGLGFSLISVDLQKSQVYAGLIATIGSFALNILLIPMFDSLGAAISSIATNSIVLLVYSLWWQRFRARTRASYDAN